MVKNSIAKEMKQIRKFKVRFLESQHSYCSWDPNIVCLFCTNIFDLLTANICASILYKMRNLLAVIAAVCYRIYEASVLLLHLYFLIISALFTAYSRTAFSWRLAEPILFATKVFLLLLLDLFADFWMILSVNLPVKCLVGFFSFPTNLKP